jgi:hypothetical protein
MAEQNREKRDVVTREETLRPKKWQPPQLLPDPEPEEGYTFRWIRISMLGNADAVNISSKLREGWEPVTAASQPKLRLFSSPNSRFPDGVEVGGLLLCKTPVEFARDRDAYYRQQADSQMTAVDGNFMRESDPRMPVFSERKSKVTFGRGN